MKFANTRKGGIITVEIDNVYLFHVDSKLLV